MPRLLLLFFCLYWAFAIAQPSEESSRPKICLNMIVKDEEGIIERCLASVRPIVDYWVIVDTGSRDRTKERIKSYFGDIPGELHERPWQNFAYNRNEALALAKEKGDYILFIDADETLAFSPEFSLPTLEKDFYYITTSFGGTSYGRVQLVKADLDWQWIGVLHETIDAPNLQSSDTLTGVTNVVTTEGARSKDPLKYQKDAAVLEAALKEDPLNSRYRFYLAQSYCDAQEYEPALKNYQMRMSLGGWDQEIFWSMYKIGLINEALSKPPETIIKSYYQAYLYRPGRIEPLYRLVHYLRCRENYGAGYQLAKAALNTPLSSDLLFVEKWIYDYGLLLEFSICAYWQQHYAEALLASKLILANAQAPEAVRQCVERNMDWINRKIAEDGLTVAPKCCLQAPIHLSLGSAR